ncbi:MAG: 50S ribosomal protein L22 [Candidatus Zixiibacteriota bacterium]
MVDNLEQQLPKDPILAQIRALEQADRRKVIKTRSRHSRVRKEYVGHTLGIFNGDGYTNVRITDDMVGRRLGKVAPRMKPTAQARYLSISARKMRQVGELVKGLPVEQALNVLNFTPKIASHHMAKTLKSAVANKLSVEGTAHLDPEHLVLTNIVVNEAPTAKRIRFRSMGRIYRIRKRYCHLAVYLDVDERKELATIARAEAKGEKAKTPTRKTVRTKTSARKPAKKKAAKKAKTAKKSAGKTGAKKSAAKKGSGSTGKAAKSEKKK